MNNINAYGWIYTPEEVEEIKKSNVEAMTSFYYNNYNHILSICKGCLFKRKCIYGQGNIVELDDLLNQVFIDLPCYDFTRLYREILKTCYGICYGGYRGYKNGSILTVSLDTVISKPKEKILTIADMLEDKTDYFNLSEELAEREEKDKRLFAFLDNHIKDEKHRNEVFCVAFTDIPLKEIKGNEYEFYKRLYERG